MDLFTSIGLNENDPVYAEVSIANHDRMLGFMESMVGAALKLGHGMVSHHLIRGLNSHAIAGLHSAAGQYRSTSVAVGVYVPPEPERIRALMDEFLVEVDDRWGESGAVALGAWALWRINHIHPFVNGNGRTARALCYYIICVKFGLWLPGSVILPHRLTQHRPDYHEALRVADTGNLEPLNSLVEQLLEAQVSEP